MYLVLPGTVRIQYSPTTLLDETFMNINKSLKIITRIIMSILTIDTTNVQLYYSLKPGGSTRHKTS